MLINLQIDKTEYERLEKLQNYETKARLAGFTSIAGVDEAGRGPLAGPVFAAACMIPEGIIFPGIDDSKKLSSKRREELLLAITSHPDVIFSVASVNAQSIDEINILQATIEAMMNAIDNLKQKPDYLLVDGLQLSHHIPSEKIIKGDSKSQSIAAASILAKVYRDHTMLNYAKKWPQYGFAKHKGYGTKLHLEAIKNYGPCPIHRCSFAPLKNK